LLVGPGAPMNSSVLMVMVASYYATPEAQHRVIQLTSEPESGT
jgi:hypothetical protein